MATTGSWARQALEWRWAWIETAFERELTCVEQEALINAARAGMVTMKLEDEVFNLIRDRLGVSVSASYVLAAIRYGLRPTVPVIMGLG